MKLKMDCNLMPLMIEVHRKKEAKDSYTYYYVLRTADSFSTKQLRLSGVLLSDIFEMLGFDVKNLDVHAMAYVSEYVVNMDKGYRGTQGNIFVVQNIKTKKTELRVEGNGIVTDNLDQLVEAAEAYRNKNERTL